MCFPHYEVQREWVQVSLHVDPLRKTLWDSSSFCLPQPQSPLGFIARSYSDCSSWHWKPWAGGSGMELGPLTFEKSLLIFICHTWVWDQPVPLLFSSYWSQCGFFFNSVVVGLPFSLISDSSEWWLSYSLVVILMWLCKEASHIYLRCHLDRKSGNFL